MQSSPRRVFLGRRLPPLESAAAWLAAEHGADLSGSIVALPGARAGRGLAERLARELGAAWVPPRIVTEGGLTDLLLLGEQRTAGRLVRTLAWERALRETPSPSLARLIARAPREHDAASWARLAEEVRRLFGELAADGLDFRAVTERAPLDGSPGEAARWGALADVQRRMAAELARAELVDPHLARLEALERGAVHSERDIILIGIAQAGELLRRTLEHIPTRVTALVFAPEDEADAFDAFGRLVVEKWAARDVPLPLEQWKVVQGPEDQARETLRVLANWGEQYAPEDISIGVAGAEVVPYLARRLADAGLEGRDAAGTPLERTAPVRLLGAVADFLDGRRFESLAALCRHPDVERVLCRAPRLQSLDVAEVLDAYLERHLPGATDDERAPHGRDFDDVLDAVHALLGELAAHGPRALPDWSGPVRALLETVHGADELDADGADRSRVAALRAIGDALGELEDCPAGLAPDVDAAQALRRITRLLHGQSVAPPQPRSGARSIELLGWLELPFDDASALVVTGFEEGRIPESVHGDAWLPNGLRKRLSVQDNDVRLARDVYAATLLLASRKDIVFISGRRSVAGDPLRPSRLAFHAPLEEIPARVRHAFDVAPTRRAEAPAANDGAARQLPARVGAALPERYSVTSFKTWLASPYLFYLNHVLEVRTVHHDGHELDPMGFGILAHDALEVLHRDDTLRCTADERRIADALESELRRIALGRFGARPLPAVELQVDQLAWRLRQFARHQAQRAEEGWRIAHSEWKPAHAVMFEVDGAQVELRGRIDRIDVHEDGRWALIDYKTGEKVLSKAVDLTHRGRDGTWHDLQLPLYVTLARELGRSGMPELGYAALGRDEANIGFDFVTDWDEVVLEEAREVAREVVRNVRRGEFFEVGRARSYEPVMVALLGQGLLAASADTADAGAETTNGDDDEETSA